jgi:hypothetical protein
MKYCLIRVPNGDEWETRFVTALVAPLSFTDTPEARATPLDREEWLTGAAPGDQYPFEPQPPTEKLKFSQRQGGVIAKKVSHGQAFALEGAEAVSEQNGRDASVLLRALKSLPNGEKISHFEIDSRLDAVYRKDGRLWFLTSLKEGLEFPE